MLLLGLLFIPIVLALVGFLYSTIQRARGKTAIDRKITGAEFAVHIAVVVVIVLAGYFLGRQFQMTDVELWNGTIAKKWEDSGSCCHSYQCNCHSCNCDRKGSCDECCDTCYEHSSDDEWYAVTTNGEQVFSDTCNRPGSSPPSRWEKIVVGEPTAVEHSFDNYIKGSKGSVLLRIGTDERLLARIPEYPRVYDLYHVDRVLSDGVQMLNPKTLNEQLGAINGDLGKRKQVDVIIVVTSESDAMYVEAVSEKWFGGKKNDFIVVIGAPHYPEIAWVDTVSWTRVEELKIAVRDRILALKTLHNTELDLNADGEVALRIIYQEVAEKFVRTPMADFAYLRAQIEPPEWILWLLFIIGTIVSIVLQVYFWKNDPFEQGFLPRRRRRRR
ncbi:MAG: hypothetical protein ABIG71_03275 [Candidatus Uhrbacteria bacterium]